jgi:hypothetical protein
VSDEYWRSSDRRCSEVGSWGSVSVPWLCGLSFAFDDDDVWDPQVCEVFLSVLSS